MNNCIIIQSGNQIDPQHKSSAAVSIASAQDAEDFQMPNDVFNNHSFLCQLTIKGFFFFTQRAAFRLFDRRAHKSVKLCQTLITTVRQAFGFFRQSRFAVLVKRKIVPCAFGKSRINDSAGAFANSQLRFYRVPLFLARIVAFLFFLGRSISHSATSTTTISTSSSPEGKRLPGKVNSPASVKISSTRVMMRETADSEIPQVSPKWNIVRYSRQYSKVKRTWSSVCSFGGLPAISRCKLDLRDTTSHILSKVFLSTPQYRLKSAAERFFSFS